ncbi:hypothetical protein PPTG_24855 [Phytophthora nicotianae INRA-310]|uniref:Uncharacterized protein n=1 Tax=Phytophthora nicotianae (strain INRA-310) TaxID=761204 RepID=W2P9H5_PHYN3|nr:hypothetical protein PPTG_24855 [Phytophthora nicotianae INRA-310]ETM97697.1 hypothetical protein PPTG_24855 [Phytophthora nicotianae INRA-310]
MEKEVIQGILEGTMLCPKLPDFLKRICDAQAYRKIQNTITAQSSRFTRNSKPEND